MISDLKRDLRKEIRSIQQDFIESLNESEKSSVSEKLSAKIMELASYNEADLIFAYIPDKYEADCTKVIYSALQENKKVCIPKVDFPSLKKGLSRMDFFYLSKEKNLEEQIEKGAYGIKEPKSDLEKVILNEIDSKIFMIVPGVAFTKEGKRLGHGKGFYDIYIQQMQSLKLKPFLCGLGLECQIVQDLPTDNHDILMNKVIY